MRPTPVTPSDSRALGLGGVLSNLVPALLGLALFGLVGFAPYPALHDAFHDIRHAAGFPCH